MPSRKATQPVASLTGEEIAPHGTDIKTLRAQAKGWYASHLKGTAATNTGSGKTVQFRGANKAFSTSANPMKLRLFVALRDIVVNGMIERSVPPVDPSREPSTKAYHWLTAWVNIDSMPQKVGITIRENQAGNLYYNHNPIPSSNSKGLQAEDRAAPAHEAGDMSSDEALKKKAATPLTRSDPAHKAGAGENEDTTLRDSVEQNRHDLNLCAGELKPQGRLLPYRPGAQAAQCHRQQRQAIL